jgi:two-component system nitrogen regulation sensor histidine kinase GlnL
MEQAVVTVNADGRAIHANSSAAILLGTDPVADPAGWNEVLRENPWLEDGLYLALDDARNHVRHQVSLRRRGATRTVGVHITTLYGTDGSRRAAVCVLSDESALETFSENARRLDRLKEMGTLAAGLAHEIKNPLGGILGAAQLLAGEHLPGAAAEYVELIERDVRRINRLIEGLLDFGNARPLKLEPVNLHRVIDDVLAGLQLDPASKGKFLVRDYDPSLPDLLVSRDAIHQVVLNLAKNALEASTPGAPVTVRTRVELAGRRRPKRSVLIDVVNEGTTLSTEARERLFTPFYSTKKSGTGLGLLMSLHLMRESGGNLDVESKNGRTVFTASLPMEAAPETNPEETPDA